MARIGRGSNRSGFLVSFADDETAGNPHVSGFNASRFEVLMAAEYWLAYILVPVYLIPSIIAIARRHRYSVRICIVNIFLGWTLYAWVVALVWSTTAVPRWTEGESGFRSSFVWYLGPFR